MAHVETMTSRERVITALNHEEPDRIPIDLGGFQTGIHKKAYQELLDHLGMHEDLRMLDSVQQLVIPSETILKKFHADIRYITARAPDGFKGEIKLNNRNGRLWHDLKDEFGIVWSMPGDQMLYMDISHHPLEHASLKDLEKYPFPNGADPSRRGCSDAADSGCAWRRYGYQSGKSHILQFLSAYRQSDIDHAGGNGI